MRILLLIFVFLPTINFAQTANTAGSYLEIIGNQFTEISKDLMSYLSAASHGRGAKKVEKKRLELISSFRESEKIVRRMRPYEGDAALRDSTASYLRLSQLVLTEDFGKIVDLEEIAEQSYDAMEAYLLAKEKANEKLDASYARVQNQYKLFAEKNNIQLIEKDSKLSEKLSTTDKVYNYYNKIYLIFFKCYKDEAYLMDALSKGELNSIEQTKNTLLNNAKEGLVKLASIGPYNYDATLKNAGQQILNFYNQEAMKTSEQVDFFLKKENYEKIKKAFESKRESERTKADINQYNQSITDFNNAVNKYNSINNELNKKRASALATWNQSMESFLEKNVPRYR